MNKHIVGAGFITTILLVSGAAAFTGESAAVNRLLDLLLKKDAKRLGDDLVGGLLDLSRNQFLATLAMNPNVMDPTIFNITKYFIAVLGPLFVSIVLFSGIYLIFFSGSPEMRTKVKATLPVVVAAMLLVILSPHIMNIILYVSESLTTSIISQMPPEPMSIILPYDEATNPINYLMTKFQRITWYSSEASMPFLLLSVLLLLSLLLVVVARYLIVTVFVIIFPLTVFLYLVQYTRSVGRRLMEQTLLWTFLQAIEATVLLCVVGLISLATPLLGAELLVLFQLVGIVILISAPIVTLIYFKDFLPI